MRRRIYGQSRIDPCPFCEGPSFTRNKQGIPVCKNHTESSLDNMKCLCGSYLDLKKGKFGSYFNCYKCGNKSMKKALDMNRD